MQRNTLPTLILKPKIPNPLIQNSDKNKYDKNAEKTV